MTTENLPSQADAGDAAAEEQAPIPSWEELGVSPEVRQALEDLGYLAPMPVQAAVFESLRAGKDMMVQARTGTGKTAAFGIPLVQMTEETEGVKALLLTPTRELALQVCAELTRLAHFRELSVVPVYGGAPIKKQMDQLAAGAQVVVGTPGRVLDHIRRKTLQTQGIKMLVLDECDEMLSMGFQEEIENIIDRLPGKDQRQTLLFSATIPDAIERIARKHLTEPEKIELSEGGISVDEIDHAYYIVSGMARMRDLLKVITVENPDSAIIFCNTRDETASVARYLTRHGYDAEAISSDLSQKDRERVMGRMRDKNLRFLVATDIAARGIDISDLPYVINYTFPESAEVYVHRTGRTGRAGKRGIALSLVGPREIGSFYYLKLIYKIQPEERDLPGNEVIAAALEGDKLKKITAKVRADEIDDEYLALAQRLIESDEREQVVAALLKRLVTGGLKKQRSRPRTEDRPGDDEHAEADGGRRRRRRRDERDEDAGSERRRTRRPRRDGDEQPEETSDGRRRRRRRPRDRDDERDESRARRAGSTESRDDGDTREDAGTAAGEAETARRTDSARDEDTGDGRRRRRRRRRRSERDDDAADASAGEDADERKVADRSGDDDGERAAKPSKARRDRKDDRDRNKEPEAEVKTEAVDEAVDEETSRSRGRDRAKKSTRSERGKDEGKSSRKRRRSKKPRSADMSEDGKEFWETWIDENKASDEDDSADDSSVDDSSADDSSADESRTAAKDDDDKDPSVRLYVNIGKREDISADDVRDLLAEGLEGEEAERIGSVALRNTHSYVRVPEDLVDAIISAAEGKSVKDRDVVVERARR